MTRREFMQRWFLEYRYNKQWCVDISKGSVSRLDVLKDKYTWTKPGFEWVKSIRISPRPCSRKHKED